MKRKLTADTGASLYSLEDTDFTAVPITVTLDGRNITDTEDVDIPEFVAEMYAAEKSGSACPASGVWAEAFDGADEAYAVTISGGLSGSYNSALMGKELFEEEHPGAKVLVVDSLTAGPEQRLITEKLASLLNTGHTMGEIEAEIRRYRSHTHILFSLQSFSNFAKNGRVSPIVAKTAQMLGIRIIACGNEEGKIEIAKTAHGAKKMLTVLFAEMKKLGFNGRKVIIGHCLNPDAAKAMRDRILSEFPFCEIRVQELGALCSYYAEKGGLLVGFEDSEA